MREPISFYKYKGGLRFYLVNCGAGLTLLIIFPDDTVMLYDCNLVDDDGHTKRNKEYILNLFSEVIPFKCDDDGVKKQYIDIFVNSHRDTDHLKGLKEVNQKFHIHSIWDSGQSGANVDNLDYKYYMSLRNTLKGKSKENLVVPTPSGGVFRSYGDAEIYVLSDAAEFVAKGDVALFEAADKIQHQKCMVLLICYEGRKMLLTGDSGWDAWRDIIVPNFENANVNYENTDILIASHHGSRTFFTGKEEIDEEKYPEDTYTESISLINPTITLISCAEYEYKGYHHPSKDAVELYKNHSDYGQVYTTNECGTFCGFIERNTGRYSVTPRSFYNDGNKRSGQRVWISCRTDKGEDVQNGDYFPIGRSLTFTLHGIGGVLNDADNPQVVWQVCNAEYCEEGGNHEIYYKGKAEMDGKNCFKRNLSFVGTHLLRCLVKNKYKNFSQQIVFVIHGTKE